MIFLKREVVLILLIVFNLNQERNANRKLVVNNSALKSHEIPSVCLAPKGLT